MPDPLIQDVSDTAFMVATYRAMETERSNALFRDPLAAKLAGEHGKAIVANLPRGARFGGWMVVIRTLIIDEFIRSAIAGGVDTILNLGAGLDTRPYRMDLPGSLLWIEADFPKIIALKEDRLSGEMPVCRLERVALDLADIGKRQRFFADIAAKSNKVLVLTEGVTPYLSTVDVGTLADALRAEPAFRHWVVDYLSPEALRYRRRMEKRMKMKNAPFKFDPADYFAFFKAHGWQPKDIRYIPEEAERLKRPLVLPFFFRIRAAIGTLFAAGNRRRTFRKSVGYVLFQRDAE
ncbi:MAG TPA: SAM-dependent methyltransferase [Methylovirgula sp.]